MSSGLFLIDDDEAIQFIVKSFVSRSGLFENFDHASNGNEALKKLINGELGFSPSVLLIDINMPVMNGFDFLDELMKLNSKLLKNISIAMFSSSENKDDMEKIKANKKIDVFLKKPFRKEYIEELFRIHNSKTNKKGA
tara:strand:+ start:162181 stop:162594 length:414 start_codon:yes stop_codon:yes gene_type:complete